MTSMSPMFSEIEAKEIANILHAIANRQRLLVLLELIEQGECSVTSLAKVVGLSRSALSQHLGKMRDVGLISFRRDSQTLWYRVIDARVAGLVEVLNGLFCRDCVHLSNHGASM